MSERGYHIGHFLNVNVLPLVPDGETVTPRSDRGACGIDVDAATPPVRLEQEQTRLPRAAEIALYRVIEEALMNTAKHSGASQYGIVIDLRGPVLSVLVEDDGHGFDVTTTARGLGLLGMSERMAQIGGTVEIESGPDAGTTVCLRVPAIGVGAAELVR